MILLDPDDFGDCLIFLQGRPLTISTITERILVYTVTFLPPMINWFTVAETLTFHLVPPGEIILFV